MRTFLKKFKNSIIGKILGAIWKIFWWALEAVMIFIAIIIVVQRVTNNEKAFLGFRIFSVATGSMEPEYAIGDVLIAKEKDPSTILVGDDIVYLGNVADYSGKIITHNVIEVEQNEKGEYLFHTKGIANTVEDPIVHEDQLYGVIFYNNEVLAFLCKILTNRYGLYFFVIIPIILYFFIDFVRIQGEKAEQEREEREKRRLEAEKRKKRKIKRVESEEIIEQEEAEEIVEELPKVTKTKKVSEGTSKTKKSLEEMPKNTKVRKVTEETQKTAKTKKVAEEEEQKATRTKKNDEETPKTTRAKKTTETKKEPEETKKTLKAENGAEKAKRTTKAKKAKEE